MKKSEIKAVDLVRRIREEHYKRLKGKTPEERRAFYRRQAEALHEKLGVRQEKRRALIWPWVDLVQGFPRPSETVS